LKEIKNELQAYFENLNYEEEVQVLEILIQQSLSKDFKIKQTTFEWLDMFLSKYKFLFIQSSKLNSPYPKTKSLVAQQLIKNNESNCNYNNYKYYQNFNATNPSNSCFSNLFLNNLNPNLHQISNFNKTPFTFSQSQGLSSNNSSLINSNFITFNNNLNNQGNPSNNNFINRKFNADYLNGNFNNSVNENNNNMILSNDIITEVNNSHINNNLNSSNNVSNFISSSNNISPVDCSAANSRKVLFNDYTKQPITNTMSNTELDKIKNFNLNASNNKNDNEKQEILVDSIKKLIEENVITDNIHYKKRNSNLKMNKELSNSDLFSFKNTKLLSIDKIENDSNNKTNQNLKLGIKPINSDDSINETIKIYDALNINYNKNEVKTKNSNRSLPEKKIYNLDNNNNNRNNENLDKIINNDNLDYINGNLSNNYVIFNPNLFLEGVNYIILNLGKDTGERKIPFHLFPKILEILMDSFNSKDLNFELNKLSDDCNETLHSIIEFYNDPNKNNIKLFEHILKKYFKVKKDLILKKVLVWISKLFKKFDEDMFIEINSFIDSFTDLLTREDDDVFCSVLDILCEISKYKDEYIEIIIRQILKKLALNLFLLQNRATKIIKNFCKIIDISRVFLSFAEELKNMKVIFN